MTTAYTSLLGLALPVTGELAGTWGDTVNNSITSLLDSAVAGTTTLSTDADVTLTTTTGSSNQARQAILLCSGARTALRTITAPAQSKIYAVVNNTTGGYAVNIVGVGPTTGVTVANGKTAVVVWNGADFVEVAPAVATNLSGGATGSVPYQSAASTTTFLSLGTAAQVLQVNAGATAPEWVSSTGTGNVVRATSPTLATPTVTTSATVPLVIGGTGTTSTLTLRSTSGVGTTGADIVFQTGNNGATEAMRVLNSGNVGIGRTPTYQLDVNSTARFNSTIGVGNTAPAASGAGVSFPATQSASSDANTLDDYEEGTFTPTVIGSSGAGTATYTFQLGQYTKVGNVVTFSIYLYWSAGTGTGNLLIGGLPFTVSSSRFPACSFGAIDGLSLTANNVATAYVQNGNTYINIKQYPAGGGTSTAVPYDAAVNDFIISGSYFTAT